MLRLPKISGSSAVAVYAWNTVRVRVRVRFSVKVCVKVKVRCHVCCHRIGNMGADLELTML